MVLKLAEGNYLNESYRERDVVSPQSLDVCGQTIERLATCKMCFLPASLPCVSTASQQSSGQSRVWLGRTASMDCLNLTTQRIIHISQEKLFLAFSKYLFQQQHYASAKGYLKNYKIELVRGIEQKKMHSNWMQQRTFLCRIGTLVVIPRRSAI